MRSARLPWKIHRAAEAGFSLAEVVVSAGLLTVSSVALMSVLNSSISSVKSISSRDQIFAAVSADLARTEKLNDYFTCFTGNCSVLDLNGPAPGKYQYAPSSDDQINYNNFQTPMFGSTSAGGIPPAFCQVQSNLDRSGPSGFINN